MLIAALVLLNLTFQVKPNQNSTITIKACCVVEETITNTPNAPNTPVDTFTVEQLNPAEMKTIEDAKNKLDDAKRLYQDVLDSVAIKHGATTGVMMELPKIQISEYGGDYICYTDHWEAEFRGKYVLKTYVAGNCNGPTPATPICPPNTVCTIQEPATPICPPNTVCTIQEPCCVTPDYQFKYQPDSH